MLYSCGLLGQFCETSACRGSSGWSPVVVGGVHSAVLVTKQVEVAVVVVVEEDGRLRMADVVQAGLLGDVGEGAVAVVAEQDVAAARAGHEQVLVAVVVVVGEGGGHADAVAQADAGLARSRPRRCRRPCCGTGRSGPSWLTEVDVVVAVAVEVADGDAAAVVVEVDLELLALLVGQEVHAEVDAGFLGPLAEAGGGVRRRPGGALRTSRR